MTERSCTDCRHSRPCDEFIAEPRMCMASPESSVKTCTFAREVYGECGPEARLYEKRAGQ